MRVHPDGAKFVVARLVPPGADRAMREPGQGRQGRVVVLKNLRGPLCILRPRPLAADSVFKKRPCVRAPSPACGARCGGGDASLDSWPMSEAATVLFNKPAAGGLGRRMRGGPRRKCVPHVSPSGDSPHEARHDSGIAMSALMGTRPAMTIGATTPQGTPQGPGKTRKKQV
jgi:hypothetical protein